MADPGNIRRAILDASDDDLEAVAREITDALEGDSNDAEHAALVTVADTLGIGYDPDKGW